MKYTLSLDGLSVDQSFSSLDEYTSQISKLSMLRVFLVIDDYNELMYLQTLLKKLGLDVEGQQNPKKYADLSLGFNPQLLITTARGKLVDGVALGKSIKKRNGYPKIIALKGLDVQLSPQQIEEAGLDLILETPINPKRLILAIANMGSVDENTLFEKFSRIKANQSGSDSSLHQKYDENGQPIEDLKKVRQNLDQLVNPGGVTIIPGDPGGASNGVLPIPQSGSPLFSLEQERSEEIKPGEGSDSAAVIANGDSSGVVAPKNHVGPAKMSGTNFTDQDLNDPSLGQNVKIISGEKPNSNSTRVPTDGSRVEASAANAQRVTPDFDPKRQERIAKCQKEIGPLPKQNFDRERILAFNKKIRSAIPAEDIDQIEGDRKSFVRSLFVKKS